MITQEQYEAGAAAFHGRFWYDALPLEDRWAVAATGSLIWIARSFGKETPSCRRTVIRLGVVRSGDAVAFVAAANAAADAKARYRALESRCNLGPYAPQEDKVARRKAADEAGRVMDMAVEAVPRRPIIEWVR